MLSSFVRRIAIVCSSFASHLPPTQDRAAEIFLNLSFARDGVTGGLLQRGQETFIFGVLDLVAPEFVPRRPKDRFPISVDVARNGEGEWGTLFGGLPHGRVRVAT